MTAFSRSQVADQPTRSSAYLDLFFTSKPDSIVSGNNIKPLSDHVSINFELAIPIQQYSPLIKCIYNYSKENVQDMCQSLEGFSTAQKVDFDSKTVDENEELFSFVINSFQM